jgi:predicted secreted protein
MTETANCSSNTLNDNQVVQTNPRNITATEKENGSRLELHRDDVLTLKLECIPGTGYSWQISRNDASVMKPPDKPEYQRADNRKAMGAVEYGIFRFKALAKGTNILELQYKRIWEKEKEPLKTFRVTVRID